PGWPRACPSEATSNTPTKSPSAGHSPVAASSTETASGTPSFPARTIDSISIIVKHIVYRYIDQRYAMIVAERQRPGAEAHRRSGEAMSQKRRGPAGPDREDESGREDAVRAEPGAGEASPVETVRPKAFGTGYELWVGLA